MKGDSSTPAPNPPDPIIRTVQNFPQYIFRIQAGAQSGALAAANAAAEVLAWGKNPANKDKLTTADRLNLESFEQALRTDDPAAHLSPQVRDAVGELLYRKPKSPIPEEQATTLRSFLAPATR
jgi:hypothetical protein